MNEINWKPKALKQLKKLNNPAAQRRIITAVSALTEFPNISGDIKTLTNHEYDYRLRVGNYRILFNHIDFIQIISIEEVKKRDEHTY